MILKKFGYPVRPLENLEIIEILDSLKEKTEKLNLGKNKKNQLLKELFKQKERYLTLIEEDIKSNEKKKVYEGIIKKGKDLIKKLQAKNIDDREKQRLIIAYTHYIRAAYFDFKDLLKPLNTGIRLFALTSALFIGLSPQFLGGAFSLFFLVPIFLGLNGLKKRRLLGFKMAMMLFPISIGISALWLRFGFNAALNFNKVVAETAQTLGKSIDIAKYFVIVPPIFAVVLLISSCLMAYYLLKSREMLL